jgi:hypothetical protein
VKIVALAAEPSVAAALNMMEDWEVFYATEPDEAVAEIHGASVVLIGGGTDEGLELAEYVRALGVTIPVVIVGDGDAPAAARYPVVTRPFTLGELHSAIDRAMTGAMQSMPAQEAAPIQTATSIGTSQPNETARRVRPLEVAPELAEVVALSAREPEVEQEPPAVAVGTDAVVTAPLPEPKKEAAPATTPDAAQSPAFRRRQEAAGRGLLRRRPREEQAPAEDPMTAALREAFDSLTSVEKAIDDLPVLTDLAELTQALLREVTDLLWPQTAAIYLPGPDGFRVWASHGFSNVEKTMAVQSHQPLFVDLLVRHESVLIEPLDMAQQLAAGVGGARTKAFLATPIEVNKKCVGVIVAGREHFENEDLDHLAALAHEAALGLGIALGLDRIRTKFG